MAGGRCVLLTTLSSIKNDLRAEQILYNQNCQNKL